MTTSFADKRVLVTGGGSGIGREIALAFAGAGASVTVTGRRSEPLAETVEQIRAAGFDASAATADLTDAAAVRDLLQGHGRLDVAVNNAGINNPGLLTDLEEDAWQQIVATNLTGTWLAMKYEIGQLRLGGGGAIVNLASTIGAHMTVPGMGAYAATKAAVSALTRTAAREYIAEGIRINAVSPGPIDTPMSRRPGEDDAARDQRVAGLLPIGRVGTLTEVANAVLWLASPAASYAVGHDLVLDGGGTA